MRSASLQRSMTTLQWEGRTRGNRTPISKTRRTRPIRLLALLGLDLSRDYRNRETKRIGTAVRIAYGLLAIASLFLPIDGGAI